MSASIQAFPPLMLQNHYPSLLHGFIRGNGYVTALFKKTYEPAMNVPYPSSPVVTDDSFLKPSPLFRANAFKVLASIVFFLAVYLSMVALAMGFGIVCWYAGLFVLSLKISFITLAVGLGIWILALMIIFFLVKFLFASNKTDRSHMIEITAETEPALFSFIKQITDETGAPFPKRIYLSGEVNASVSYDSSFWSMFFPVRKNLTIGLGLVNATNLSEFKAIMGHEFGHFSQKSMKLGSYIYNVNKVVYNMLYENESYGNLIQKWGSIHGIFAILAHITVWVVRMIQKLLQVVYSLINKIYSGLSLQMEYHADAVAASVAGSNHLVTSLYRLEAADMCYNSLIGYYNTWLAEQYKAENIYRDHTYVMTYFSEEFKAPVANGLMQVNEHTLASFSQSNIVIKNQWASHPSAKERQEKLESLGLTTEADHRSPWILFADAAATQAQMTTLLFSGITYEKEPVLLSEEVFISKYTTLSNRYKLHELYKGYYDGRAITFDTQPAMPDRMLHDLLSDANISLPRQVSVNNTDLITIEQIRTAPLKTFDYKGNKYKKKHCDTVKEQIEAESGTLEQNISDIDRQLYLLAFQRGSAGEQDTLTSLYATYFKALEAIKFTTGISQGVRTHLYEFSQQTTPQEAERWNMLLKEKEKMFITQLRELIAKPEMAAVIIPKQQIIIDAYLAYDLHYFLVDSFVNESLDKLNNALAVFDELIADELFLHKKKVLDMQAGLLLRQS
jgi:Zn-dependent protease with chaperone function